MRRAALLAAICALLGILNCIPISLYPFYSESDLIFDSTLIGTWGQEGEKGKLVIEPFGPNVYALIDKEEERESKFDAHLFRLGDELFLDLYPWKLDCKVGALYGDHLVSAHSCFHVQQIEPTLIITALDQDWLEDYLRKNPKVLSHAILDDQIILTAVTDDLQAFMLKSLAIEGAHSDPLELLRLDQR